MAKAELIHVALAELDGYKVEPGKYAYQSRDEGPLIEYILASDDWATFGQMLRSGMRDAYSHWCAQTTPLSRRQVAE